MMAGLLKTSWPEKWVATVKAAPGKSSFAGFLAVVLILLWMRFLFWGHHPASASGAMTRGSTGATVARPDDAESARAIDEAASLQRWARQPVKPLARNPFDIPLDDYPRDGSKISDNGSSATGYWDLVRKSMSSRADQQEQRQILIDNVRIAAGSLQLQSTVLGAHPGAMVNGQMVCEGDKIAGFRVVKIEARQIIVEREGIELAVLME
jgi:hypothetical protein